MTTNTADLKVRFDAEWDQMQRATSQIQTELDRTARAAQRTTLAMAGLEKNLDDEAAARWDRQARAMESAGRALIGFGTAAAIGFGYAAKTAMDWESAWAGVTKTVDGSSAQLGRLEKDLRGIATTMPASHDEIAAVAEAAGQLGVKTENIAKFTKTMVMLGTTTNLSAEDAANGLARFANVMGTSQGKVDRLGSSLVALGNDGASTESEILEMAQRIAGAGKQLDISEPKVLAMASALSSVGIRAEAGGSSMSTLLVNIQEAVSEGGGKLETFAKVSGVSADTFKKKFGEDAAGAFNMFVTGLGRIKNNGGDTLAVLKDLGITETRQRDAVLRLAGAGDLLGRSLKVGNRSWRDNTALIKEAEKRYETTESKAKIAFNTFKDGAIDIGNILLPAISSVVETGRDLLVFFNNLPGPVKTLATVLGVAATGVALVGGAALIAIPKIVAFKTAVSGLSAGPLKSAAGGLSRFAGFMTGPWGAAIGVGLTALTMYAAKQGKAKQEIDEVTDTLNDQTGAITKNTREWVASKIADELGDVADQADKAGISMETLAKAAIGDPEAIADINDEYERLRKEATRLSSGLNYSTNELSDSEKERLDSLGAIREVIGSTSSTLRSARGEWEAQNEVTKALGNETKKTGAKQEGTNEAWGEGADAAGDLADEAKELREEFEDLTGATLDEREAKRGWFEALRDVNGALKENGKTLDVTTKKGSDNQDKIDSLVESSYDWLDAQDKVGVSAKAVKRGFDRQHESIVQALIDFGLTRKQAETTADKLHKLPADWKLRIREEGAKQTRAKIKEVDDQARKVTDYEEIGLAAPRANKVADQLDHVDDSARGILDKKEIELLAPRAEKVWDQLDHVDRSERAIADKHEVDTSAPGAVDAARELRDTDKAANGINGKNVDITLTAKAKNVLNAADKVWKQLGMADGGTLDYYANGGTREHHVAQIAPKGSLRVWAEDETDGEAYIPFALGKRQRSLDIWRETGRRLGVEPEYHADGAIRIGSKVKGNPQRIVRNIDTEFEMIAGSLTKGYSKALSKAIEQLQVGFHWPVPRKYGYSGSWGSYSSGGSHPALDFPAPTGTPVYSVLPGRVMHTTSLGDRSYGNYIEVKHGPKLSSLHAHLSAFKTRPGALVAAGERIGSVGSVGNSTGPHDHVEVKRNGVSFDFTNMLESGVASGIVGAYDGDHSGLDRASPARAKAYARSILGKWGWPATQWPYWEDLGNRESGWRWNALNESSGAYGIPQSLPASKMASSGPDWRTNAGTQIDWMAGYIKERYDGPHGAINWHNAHNWYKDGNIRTGRGVHLFDNGGEWKHGQLGINLSGGTEYVVPRTSYAQAKARIGGINIGGGSNDPGKNQIGSLNLNGSAQATVVPGAIRSFKDLLELVSKPDTVRNLSDLNKAWRQMRNEAGALDREEAKLRRMRERSRVTNKQVRETERALEEAKKRDEKATDRVTNLEDKLSDLRSQGGDKLQAVDKAEQALIKTRAKASKDGKTSKAEQRDITEAEKNLKKARKEAGGETKKIRELEARLRKARDEETVSGDRLTQMRTRLKTMLDRQTDSGKALEKQEKAVERQRDKLAKATERWKTMQQELIAQAREVAESITSAGQVFGGEGTSVTAQGLASKLTGAGSNAEAYGRLLKRVKDRHVDTAIIDQILEQGQTPESLALLRSLANAPVSLIKRINRQQTQLEATANQIGTWTITPQRHQGGGNNGGGNNGPNQPAGRSVQINFNGPIQTTDIKKLSREIENRWNRAAVLVRNP